MAQAKKIQYGDSFENKGVCPVAYTLHYINPFGRWQKERKTLKRGEKLVIHNPPNYAVLSI